MNPSVLAILAALAPFMKPALDLAIAEGEAIGKDMSEHKSAVQMIMDGAKALQDVLNRDAGQAPAPATK